MRAYLAKASTPAGPPTLNRGPRKHARGKELRRFLSKTGHCVPAQSSCNILPRGTQQMRTIELFAHILVFTGCLAFVVLGLIAVGKRRRIGTTDDAVYT